MEKIYIVIASGSKGKKSGKPYSIAKRIVKLDNSEFIAYNDSRFLEECKSVGETLVIDEKMIF